MPIGKTLLNRVLRAVLGKNLGHDGRSAAVLGLKYKVNGVNSLPPTLCKEAQMVSLVAQGKR